MTADRTYLLEDLRGVRQAGDEAFPLAIGGPQTDLQVSGFSGEPLAWLGLSDGELFVQPAAGPRRLTCNGAPLGSSRWLRDGDVLDFGGGRLEVEIGENTTRLRLRDAASEELTEPPLIVAPPRQGSEEEAAVTAIRPIDYRPRTAPAASRGRRRLRPAAMLLAATLAALAAVAGLLFTARAVEVEIAPPPQRLVFEGGPFLGHFPLELGGRHLMRPGSYTLVAERPGYRRLETPVEVSREPHQTLRFELQRLPGKLRVSTVPEVGVEVRIDGETVGTTPLPAVELPAGEHEVRLRAPRHEEHASRVTLEGGGVLQELEVRLTPAWAPVTFASQPPGARVRLEGEDLGATPLTAEVAAGAHRFELRLAGYKPHRGRLEVAAGQPLTLPPVTLQPSDGNLLISSEPTEAVVTVDGIYRGETPLDLALEPGPAHRVQVSKSGYAPQEQAVDLVAGARRELSFRLQAREGEVAITPFPPDAEVVVGGEPRGRGSQTLRLPAVPQEIEVRKDGYEPFRRTVTPLPGLRQTVEATLLKVGAAKPAAAAPPVLRTSEGQELRRIEPGKFVMGASRREPGRRSNEVLRQVELTRPFYLGVEEVSNRQFRRFRKDHLSGQLGGHSLEIDHHPVVRVSWEEAVEYCNWLSEKEGLPAAYVRRDGRWLPVAPVTTGYRLPTEAEWAWAARFPDGTTRKYPWGDALPVAPGSGNYADAAARDYLPAVLPGFADGYPTTAPVDAFPPNPLGVYNLGGNVAEWVQDLYGIRPPGTESVERDPLGPEDGELHVIRGSSFLHSTITELRLTFRDYGSEPRPDVGFRIARSEE